MFYIGGEGMLDQLEFLLGGELDEKIRDEFNQPKKMPRGT